MSRRHQDWLQQARRDLKAARDSASAENYEWACFQAQHSAEKALKALLRFHNLEPKGHTLIALLQQAAFASPRRVSSLSHGNWIATTFSQDIRTGSLLVTLPSSMIPEPRIRPSIARNRYSIMSKTRYR